MNARHLLLLFSLGTMVFTGCSLILDKRADQCSSDNECARFEGTRCDLTTHLCVAPPDDGGGPPPTPDAGQPAEAAAPDASAEADAAEPCRGANGCFQCVPTTDIQFASACTDAGCKPFDNRTRLKNLRPDGGLLPLPERDAGGP
jgi:hypothetical protein